MPGYWTIFLAYVRLTKEKNKFPSNSYVSTLYKLNTKRESIFHLLDELVFILNKENHLSNIVSLVTDDGPLIVGRYKGFLDY